MQKFDVLSRHLDVFASHFVEASAGTGKTFAIEHLVTRLLIEGENPLTIDQILVITFTRAATRELKMRIRNTLVQVRARMQEGSSTQEVDYLLALAAQGEEKISQAMRRIEEALFCFDQAQIFTVHGFCHRALTECAFEAHVGLDHEEPSDTEHLHLLEQTIDDFLRTKAAFPLYSPSQIHRVLNKTVTRLRKRILNTLNRNREIAPFSTFSELHHQLQQGLKEVPQVDRTLWQEDFDLLKLCYYEMKRPHIALQAVRFGRMLEERACTVEEFEDFLKEEEFFLEKMAEDRMMKRVKMPENLHYPGLISWLRKTLLPLFQTARNPAHIFLRMVRDCQEEGAQAMCRQEKLSPDALLEAMHTALQNPAFVERIRHKTRAAIIDEFQDTDPLQWEIFRTLFLGKIETVCVVGDPKQSIYAFRNADVYTYLKAAHALGEKSRAYLDTNFRSSFALTEALNTLFARKGWMRLPAQGIVLDTCAVKAHALPEKTSAGRRGSVHFFLAEGSATPRTKRWPTEQLQKENFFPFIAEEILALRQELRLEWEAFAILVKDRYQARALLEFLQTHHIPACLKRGGALNDSPAFFMLRDLLEAVCFPRDLSHLKKVLAGPLVGWTAEMVQGDLEKESLQEAKAKFLFFHALLYKEGFAPFFQTFLQEMHVVERLLSHGELALYSDLRQLAEILIAEELTQKISQEGFLHVLQELQEEDPEEESRLQMRSQEEKGSVALMTVHKSKGLEFDTVFALGLASRHAPGGEIALKRAGKEEIAPFDAQDLACQHALYEADAEKMRQLYVALTRAKNRVYVPVALNNGSQESLSLGCASPSELFLAHMLSPGACEEELYARVRAFTTERISTLLTELGTEASITHALCKGSDGLSSNPRETEPEFFLSPPPPFTPPGKVEYLSSFTSLAHKAEDASFLLPPEPSPFPTAHTLPLGAETGCVFHRIMEKIFQAQAHLSPHKEKIEQLVAHEVEGSPLQPWQEVLSVLVKEILQLPLFERGIEGAATFSLSEVPPHQIQQEMEFAYEIPEGIMKGFADLFFEFKGSYYLLDWKSNFLGPKDEDYSQENLRNAMQKNDYYLQAALYAEALRRYVKLFDMRPFEACFGGAIYLFVRGKAALQFIPKQQEDNR